MGQRYPKQGNRSGGRRWRRLGLWLVMGTLGLAPTAAVAPRRVAADGTALEYLRMGYTYYGIGWADIALEKFQSAVQRDPGLAEAHLAVAMALEAKGDLDGAAAAYRRAAALSPLGEAVLAFVGDLELRQGHWQAAQQEYRRALGADPQNARAQLGLGLVAEHVGDLDGAIARFRRTVELAPEFGEAYVHLGRLLRRTGKVDQALEVLQKGRTVESASAELYVELGLAYAAKGATEQALHWLDRALQLDPDNAEAREQLARLKGQRQAAPPAAP